MPKLVILIILALGISLSGCGGGDSSPAPLNQVPTANAGADQSVDEGTTVNLSATGADSDGTIASYSWGQISGTTAVTITNADMANASFVAPTVTATEFLVFRVQVTDDDGATGADTVSVTVNDIAPPPPPPPVAQGPSGAWGGPSVSVAAADVFTDFEFNAAGGFSVGTTPYTVDFSSGNAQTIGNPAFYISGTHSWHVPVGTAATVTFETLPNTLTFFVRMPLASDVGNIDIFDEDGMLILNVVPTNVFQPLNAPISVVRGAGQTLIGSVVVTSTSGGDVVIDDLTFGYDGSGFVGSTDDVICLVADNREFICILADTAGNLLASAQGTMQVANTNQVSGSGTLYAVPGSVLADGKTVANLTISGGTVSEGNTLNLTVEAAGTTSTVSTMFDPIYNRGSALATVAGVYDLFIFDDPSSFTIDGNGAISGQSIAGCVLSGDVTPKNATFNEYDVALGVMDISNCGVPDGMYVGLGLALDLFVMDDTFVFAVFTTQSSVVGIALKP